MRIDPADASEVANAVLIECANAIESLPAGRAFATIASERLHATPRME